MGPVSGLECEAPPEQFVAASQSSTSCDRFAMLSASQKHDPLTASLRPTWRSPLSDDHVRSQDVGVVAAIVGRKRESSPGTHRDTCRLLALKRTSATCSSREASAVAL